MLALFAWMAPPTQAAFPGQNGKIVFEDDGVLRTIEPDGTGLATIPNTTDAELPAWSPDGSKIAFTRAFDVFVMNADGSNQQQLTTAAGQDTAPAWSPDGAQIAFQSNRDGDHEIWAMNANGTNQHQLTSDPAFDATPAWSPDGLRIAFVSSRGDGESRVWRMDASGANPQQLSQVVDVEDERPSWSPDGARVAFGIDDGSNVDIFTIKADGTDEQQVTNNANSAEFNRRPAWSPDGTRIAFSSNRTPGGDQIWLTEPDGAPQTQLTTGGGTFPDWQRLPGAVGACGDTRLQLNRATVEGELDETGPGTGEFRAGPGDVVFVGGFELRPRFGGELVVDTNATQLREEGAGVQVVFGRFDVPLSVGSIPINQPEATIALNRDGTLLKTLFSIPISGQLKAAWTDGGKGAGLELELEAEKLLGNFGSFTGAGVTAPSLKVAAKQANCTGFDFTGAEIKADELSFTPTRLRVPRKLGLRNILFKYEEPAGVSRWTGQGEMILPTGTGELSVGGKVTIADTKLGGVGVSASGINRHIGYGLFLQRVAGELAFEPEYGANFGADATLGPQVQGKKLVKLGGSLKSLALAPECINGQDPIALVGTGSIPLVEELGAGSVKIDSVNCIYTNSLGIEQSPKIEAVFGEVVGGEVPRPVVAAKANLSGFVGESGFNAEGGGSITMPLIGDLVGQVLLSSNAFAACGRVGFFSGGAAHTWGQSRTDTFTGCDLAPWRAGGAGASRLARARVAAVGRGLPFVGFAAQGVKGPPRVRVTGPRRERFTSRRGRALIRRNVVMVPVASERRTFVFVKRPSAGRWRIRALGGERLRQLRTARGLPKPRVIGAITGTGARRTLSYSARRIPGQRVEFVERTEDGIVKPIGRATRATGRIGFAPASSGQAARIDAIVSQNGFPRDTVTVARFRSSQYALPRRPARPRRVRAKRVGRGLAIAWSRVARAARYRVELRKGRRRIVRRTVTGTRLRLKRVPAGRIRVEVRAVSLTGAASRPRTAAVRGRRPRS